jgi:hypothetical protein
MLVVSTGQERTKEEMEDVFDRGGWKLVNVSVGAHPMLALFEGVKK